MATTQFGGTASGIIAAEQVIGGNTLVTGVPNALVTCWTTPTGGTQAINLTDASSNPIQQFNLDSLSYPPVFYDLDGHNYLWLQVSGLSQRVQVWSFDGRVAGIATQAGTATKTALDGAYASRANNLSDLASAATARTNLGLGSAAPANIDTTAADFQMDGTASAGSTGKVADAGHVHPTDTSRAPATGSTTYGAVVNHGSTASTARPSSTLSVRWVGTVTPANAVNNDTYLNVSTGTEQVLLSGTWTAIGQNREDHLNVTDFGVVGDNSTLNNLSALNSAINSFASSGSRPLAVYWPPGKYLINAPLQPVSNIRHYGAAPVLAGGGTAQLTWTTGNMLVPPNVLNGVSFERLQITQQSGAGHLVEMSPVLAKLSAALTTSGAITSLPITALSSALANGATITLNDGASHVQTWTLSAAAAAGATSLTVVSQTPNFAYPANTTTVVSNAPGLVFSDFTDCYIDLRNPNASFIHQTAGPQNLFGLRCNSRIERLQTHTVPAIDLQVGAGVNHNVFQRGWWHSHGCTSTPFFRCVNLFSSGETSGFIFDGLIGEQNAGGMIHFGSPTDVIIRGVHDNDQNSLGNYADSLFKFYTAAGGAPKNVRIDNSGIPWATAFNAGAYHVYIADGTGHYVGTIENGQGQPTIYDAGNGTIVACPNPTLSGSDANRIVLDGANTPRFTGGFRVGDPSLTGQTHLVVFDRDISSSAGLLWQSNGTTKWQMYLAGTQNTVQLRDITNNRATWTATQGATASASTMQFGAMVGLPAMATTARPAASIGAGYCYYDTTLGQTMLSDGTNWRDDNGCTTTAPTGAAGSNAGTTPPAPVVTAGAQDGRGNITFGTGTAPAAGNMVAVTFGTAYAAAPSVMVTPRNAATAALGLYVTGNATTGFTLACANAPAASQANTVYSFDFAVRP